MPATFRTTRLVEFGDTDMAGIVHFAQFFRYMEAAEHAMLRSLGLGVSFDWEGQKIGFPRRAASCDYLRPARFDDLLTITVAISRLGRSSVTYDFEFFKEEELIARGQLTAVFCRVNGDGRLDSCEMPPPVREKLG
jgi:YbgC/YbaW family acyl-CoA thioester hydrolase